MIIQESVKYIFLDIVQFSHNRTVESQTKIINSLNQLVKKVLSQSNISVSDIIYLPTGDGLCICLINNEKPFDLTLNISINLLKELNEYNDSVSEEMEKYQVRIGINENVDNIVEDINQNRNVAGSGINMAQRIMNCADGNQILLGISSYEKICDRQVYYRMFSEFETVVKHGKRIKVYQYIERKCEGLNVDIPSKFKPHEKVRKRPTRILFVYLTLVKYFEEYIKDQINEFGNNSIPMHIILIYTSLRINELFNKNVYDSFDQYEFCEKYLQNGINFEDWKKEIENIEFEYRTLIENALIQKYLEEYEDCFLSNSDFFVLSDYGRKVQENNLISLCEYINKKINITTAST